MMYSDTKRKLEEAKYFLKQMQKNKNQYHPFIYNLSAFLSAARSITFFMQKLYKKAPNFNKWYNLKQNEMKKDKDFDFFNDMRLATVHTTSVIPNQTLTHNKPEKISIADSILIQQVDKNGKIIVQRNINSKNAKASKISENQSSFELIWMFKERSDRTVLQLCEAHIKKLEKLVIECEEKYDKYLIEVLKS